MRSCGRGEDAKDNRDDLITASFMLPHNTGLSSDVQRGILQDSILRGM